MSDPLELPFYAYHPPLTITRKHELRIEVENNGAVNALLVFDGLPVDGHRDNTGTQEVKEFMPRFLQRLMDRIEADRR